jgi:hypothetical protein
LKYTYDLNTNGCLIITADSIEREHLKELANEQGEFTCTAEYDALESLVCNSELNWIQPEEISALTSAPILGLRDEQGEPIAAWAFMDYQVRSFVSDLIETGKAVFIS